MGARLTFYKEAKSAQKHFVKNPKNVLHLKLQIVFIRSMFSYSTDVSEYASHTHQLTILSKLACFGF